MCQVVFSLFMLVLFINNNCLKDSKNVMWCNHKVKSNTISLTHIEYIFNAFFNAHIICQKYIEMTNY